MGEPRSHSRLPQPVEAHNVARGYGGTGTVLSEGQTKTHLKTRKEMKDLNQKKESLKTLLKRAVITHAIQRQQHEDYVQKERRHKTN